jgi:hypothetical protein
MVAEFAGKSFCDIQPRYCHKFYGRVKHPAYSVLDKTKV